MLNKNVNRLFSAVLFVTFLVLLTSIETAQEFKGVGIQKIYKTGDELEKDADADCKCENGICVNDGKRDICTCRTGWGKYKSDECRECNCGKGINCTFDPGFWSVDKYCICPDGKTLKNKPCKVDYCVDDPCKNGGTCQNVKDDYTCNCRNGYLGKNCENIDNCVKDPCKNGGTCQNEKKSYTCKCPGGYFGRNCENIGNCESMGKEVCGKQGKRCQDTIEGYQCNGCEEGFMAKKDDPEYCVIDNCAYWHGYYWCGEKGRNCTSGTKDSYICEGCKDGFKETRDDPGNCLKETCERFGVNECKEVGRHCIDRENGIGFTCGDCLENFEEENGTCVANFCLSSPCKNNGICKMENGSFVCFCKHPFCGKTCEVEINPTTSSHLNVSTSVPDFKTTTNNSIWTTSERFNWTTYLTTKPSNYSHDYNLTTVELDTTPSPVTETPNITLVDFLTTKPTNYSRDYNLTTTEVSSTPLSTTSDTVNTTATSSINKTTIDTTATTVTVDTTTTSSEKPSTFDRGIQIIFRNDYTIRNLTEVKIKM